MGRCVYLGNGSAYSWCNSDKHPNYNKFKGCAPFGTDRPKCCDEDGKGCPTCEKEKNLKK